MDDPGGDLSWSSWGRCVLHMLETLEANVREIFRQLRANDSQIGTINTRIGDLELRLTNADHATALDVKELMVKARNQGLLAGGGIALVIEILWTIIKVIFHLG
jgi:hypothetical protein